MLCTYRGISVQYLDGTTNVTRTLHFGTPTAQHRACSKGILLSTLPYLTGHCTSRFFLGKVKTLTKLALLLHVSQVLRRGDTCRGLGVLSMIHLFSKASDPKDPDHRHVTGPWWSFPVCPRKMKWHPQLVGHSARCAETPPHLYLGPHGIGTRTW